MAVLSNLSNYKNFGLLVIRLGLGITFIFYGYPMLMGGVSGWKELGHSTKHIGIHFWPVVWGFLAAATEAFGGFLLLIGFAFRPVCILMILTLIVAAATHLGEGEGVKGAIHAIEDALIFAGLLLVRVNTAWIKNSKHQLKAISELLAEIKEAAPSVWGGLF